MLRKILKFLDHPHSSENKSVDFNNRKDFLFLPDIFSVRRHLYLESVTFVIFLAVIFYAIIKVAHFGLAISPIVIISGSISFFYLFLMVFKLYVVYHAVNVNLINFSNHTIDALDNEELPMYTILVPLYNEARVIPQIVKALSSLDYPKDKLEILITLEEYDNETRRAIERANPPSYFRIVTLPNVKPKTKPKALNVAFQQIKGQYVVIYDAEIIPDPDQLKKAHLAFKYYPEYAAFQTRLDHYNADHNLLTRLFNAEFSFYYDLFLPGLQKLNFPIPLSGHSVHFRRLALLTSGGWDPYNVAEDCDMGIRLYRMGYRVGILDSVSREEATDTVVAWAMQRTRWMKGFIQTSIVHLRHPFRFKDDVGGYRNFFAFILIVPGSVFLNISNILYWFLLIGWLTSHSSYIQHIFPGVILTISFASFILGNFIFTYLNLIGSYRRGRMNLVKWSLCSPLYWVLLSIATVRAAVQILFRPHYWEKTAHGAGVKTLKKEETKNYTPIYPFRRGRFLVVR